MKVSSCFRSLSVAFRPRLSRGWWVLSLICCLLALIFIISSTSSTSSDLPAPGIYSSSRRLKEQLAVDYLDASISLGGGSWQSQVGFCGRERENFVPCYNVSANFLSGFKNGEEFDRHCGISVPRETCLVRPPKDYQIPLRWPAGRDVIWSGNVKITKDQFLSSGSMTKRLMLLEENQIAFHSEDGLIIDGVKDYSRQIAEMIGLGGISDFEEAGVQTVLDIGCGFGSFGAYLLSLHLMVVCVAAYEATGSQVQVALERGLPAMIGNFMSRQLPFPSLSFDMVHCAQCGIAWDENDGLFLVEVDRLLKPRGYFVLTSPTSKLHGASLSMKKRSSVAPLEEFIGKIPWDLVAQQDETFIWQKSTDVNLPKSSRKMEAVPFCNHDDLTPYYQPIISCKSRTASKRWVAIQNKSAVVESSSSSARLGVHGVEPQELYEDSLRWRSALKNYWSLLTPLIFSDHPKRLADDDPLPPFNMVRNVMDMNAHYGGLNAAFLDERKPVWVMNVVPIKNPMTLPLILDRGFVGVWHDWCEPFPTYPRTYDMLHADGLLSSLSSWGCSMKNLILEMDRILRPEGWVVVHDKMGVIELARALVTRIRWEARVIDLQNGSQQGLLVCQKPFLRK